MSADWHLLGAEIRARREALGITLRALARTVGLSPSTLSLAERGGPVVGLATLGTLAAELRVDDATSARWSALAGHLPDDLTTLLLAHPAWWGEVRAMLARVPRCGNCPTTQAPGETWPPVTVPWSVPPLRLCPSCLARGVESGVLVPKQGGGRG